jgi:hypothetical protein
MKSLIKKLLKQKLNEVAFDPHFYERSEDRVWGKKEAGPASINAPAYEGKYVSKRDLQAYDEKLKKLYIANDIPLTREANKILALVDQVAPINFKISKGLGIILWASTVVHTGKGQNPPGGTLLMIVRNNVVVTIQWQPNTSVNVGGGAVTDVDYLVQAPDLIKYANENGKSVINLEDILKITGKFVPEKPKDDIIIFNGAKYVIANRETGDIKQKNGDKVIKFDDLPEDLQAKILDIIG